MEFNTIEECDARLTEIRSLLDSDQEVDVDALTNEVNEITGRKAELKDDIEKRRALMNAVANGTVGTVKENNEMETSNEERNAQEFVKTGHLEMRAVLSTGKIAKPTAAGGINELGASASDVVDDVNAIALAGNGAWVAAYKKAEAGAADVTDGSDIAGTEAEFDYVTINPAEVGVFSEISKQVAKMTPVDYAAAVTKSSLTALRAAMSKKILAAVQASDLAEKATVALDQDYLRTIALTFHSAADKGEVMLYIPQADLITLGKVRGTDKKPVYEIAFDAGTTRSGVITEGGLAVKFRIVDLAAGTQLFGQPAAIDMPMWDNYEVSTDEGGEFFKKNVMGVRGLQTANADLVTYHGMMVVSQGAA